MSPTLPFGPPSQDPKMGRKTIHKDLWLQGLPDSNFSGELSMSPGVTRMDAWRQSKEKNQGVHSVVNHKQLVVKQTESEKSTIIVFVTGT